jgi:hypothetical protein
VSNKIKSGRVNSIRYTRNGFGEQYTSINGVTYVTYFDLGDPKLKGLSRPWAHVRFTSVDGPTKLCDSPRVTVECGRATLIEVVCSTCEKPLWNDTDTVNGGCRPCWDREITREKDEDRR